MNRRKRLTRITYSITPGTFLDSGHRVFLGAQTIKVADPFDDDVEDTTDLVLGEDYQYETVGWLLIVRDEGE